jgi:hypothetical protein
MEYYMSIKDELPMPDAAQKDMNSFELIRIWIANNDQHFSLRTEVWEDPAAWGIMLSDLVKNLANTYEGNPAETIERIKEAFDLEIKT